MDTGAERRPSRDAHAGVLEFENQPSFPFLVELALALPLKVAHITRAFLRPGARRPGRRHINTPPMSDAWLIHYGVASGKQGDAL